MGLGEACMSAGQRAQHRARGLESSAGWPTKGVRGVLGREDRSHVISIQMGDPARCDSTAQSAGARREQGAARRVFVFQA